MGKLQRCLIYGESYTVYMDGLTPETVVKDVEPNGADCNVTLDVMKDA